MIEIDPGIMDASVLMEKVKISAQLKNIPKEFYSDLDKEDAQVNISSVHQMMFSVYQNIQMMNATWIITEKPLKSAHPVIGKIIVFLKRAYRKMTRWLFQSYYQQQTEFNGAATRTISDMIKIQEMLITIYERENNSER